MNYIVKISSIFTSFLFLSSAAYSSGEPKLIVDAEREALVKLSVDWQDTYARNSTTAVDILTLLESLTNLVRLENDDELKKVDGFTKMVEKAKAEMAEKIEALRNDAGPYLVSEVILNLISLREAALKQEKLEVKQTLLSWHSSVTLSNSFHFRKFALRFIFQKFQKDGIPSLEALQTLIEKRPDLASLKTELDELLKSAKS